MKEGNPLQVISKKKAGAPTYLFRLPLAAFLLGVLSIIAQIILAREVMSFCSGNEASLGLFLGSWLLGTGLGALTGGILLREKPAWTRFLPGVLLVGAVLFFLTYLGARLLPSIGGISVGEVVGMGRAAILILPLPLTYCFINGTAFALVCGRAIEKGTLGRGFIYAAEALGAGVGGLLVFYLPGPPSTIAGLLAGGYCLGALLAGNFLRWPALVLGILFCLFSFKMGQECDRVLTEYRWDGCDFLDRRASPYAELTVLDCNGQIGLFSNGMLIHSWPGTLGIEEEIWPVLLSHTSPGKVLLLGGSPNHIKEIRNHPQVKEVVWVEIDPGVVSLLQKYMGKVGVWAQIIIGDPRTYLSFQQGKWDVIILSVGDPLNAQVNRFYTEEFFHLVAENLSPGGLFTFSAISSPNYLGPELRKYLGLLQRTLSLAFPQIQLIPGSRCRFIASPDPSWSGINPEVWAARANSNGIDPDYLEGGYLLERVSKDRIRQLAEALSGQENGPINRDSFPLCYYYDMVFWSSFFKSENPGWWHVFLKFAPAIRWWWFLAFGLVIGLIRIFKGTRVSTFWPVAVTGFSGILFQVIIMISFQGRYGSLYSHIGLLVGTFMVGSALGAWGIDTRASSSRKNYIWLNRFMFLDFFLGCGLAGIIFIQLNPGAWTYYLFALFSGSLTGGVFSLASRIKGSQRGELGAGGMVYGFDLLGACLGGVLGSLVLIPLLGLGKSALIIAALALSAVLATIKPGTNK